MRVYRFIMLAALLAPLQGHAQDVESARAFTWGLYRAYEKGEPDYAGKQAPQTFAPHLLSLIRRDQAATQPGDVGILDGDPICSCQDHGGMKATDVKIKAASNGHVEAAVTLNFPDGVRLVRLDLQEVSGQWRVADVHTKDTPSLVGLMEGELAKEHGAGPQPASP
jgi:hypothetical protein